MIQSPYTGEAFPAADDGGNFWVWDKIHAPRPVTPLSADLVAGTLAEGFTLGQAEFASLLGMGFWHVNYYVYFCFYPLNQLDSEGAKELAKLYDEALERMVPKVGELWENEWLPSLLPEVMRARDADYAGLGDSHLIAELARQQAQMRYRWDIHGRLNFILIAASRFSDFYRELVKPEDETEGYEALQGYETKSLDAGRGLWRLSRQVRADEQLTSTFKLGDARSILSELETSPSGRAFLRDFTAYLDEYGWRSDAVYDIADVPWREDPSIAINTLQGYVQLDGDADPDLQFEKSVAKREALMQKAREACEGDQSKLRQLNALFEAARRNLSVTEDHAYYIDQVGVTTLRLPVLEVAQRLTSRGLLGRPEDVFFLYLSELNDSLIDGTDYQTKVVERRQEMARFAGQVPPLTIGAPPQGSNDPFIDAVVIRMLGPVFERAREDDILRGVPASPGVVTGVVKVVRSLAEASKLQHADIMVCEMTVPPWTPLFSTIGAVIADTGGILSHCAIVAREYRLPAVVGTVVGTTVLKDGMTVTVDGAKGIVRIEPQ